jgi:glycosyltransferase involved in cell wall biosynthesis
MTATGNDSTSGGTEPEKAAATRRRLRVVHLHSTLGIFGAERWTLALLKNLDPQSYEAAVVTFGTKQGADAFYNRLLADGHKALHLPFPGRLNPAVIRELRKLLLQDRVDILHTHGFKADVTGYFATRFTPVRLVSTIHGWSADEGRLIGCYEAVSRFFLKRFDCVYPLSPALYRGLEQHGFDTRRLRLVLNSVDLQGLHFGINRRDPQDPFEVLFVGRIYRPKGIFDLVQAFAMARLPASSRLTIVGDGEDAAELAGFVRQLGIADRVILAGTSSTVPDHLASSHALVLPSHAEGIPRVIMEAFAAGTPVAGTDIPGIRQLVTDGVSGLLSPVGDPARLARSMEQLCENPDLAGRMAMEARTVIEENYSAARMASDFDREYRLLCAPE